MTSSQAFVVARDDLQRTRFIDQPQRALNDGEVRVRVQRFALTTNNITYAETGDSLGYWQFFPVEAGWGCIPVWGFAQVQESRCEGIEPGERIYGFLPMATHLVLTPQRLSESHFVDASAHREKLPPAYNLYVRVAGDALHRAEYEDLQLLLRPVFITSFLIDDFLDDESFFGATRVLLSSASSKTAFGLAHLLHQREGIEVVGLTSAGNREFVQGLGCYHRVCTYDEIATLDAHRPSVYVDFAGSPTLRHAVHAHLGDALKFSSAIGLTHRDLSKRASPLPGPKPIFFFAPDRLRKRARDWGRDGIDKRVAAAWLAFAPVVQRWLSIKRADGAPAIEAAYGAALGGSVPANEGVVLAP